MPRHNFEDIKHDLVLIKQIGGQFVIPARKKEWDDFCDEYEGAEPAALELLAQIVCIMEQLKFSYDNDSNYWTNGWASIYEQSQKEIGHSVSSWNYVLLNVAKFSPFGVHYVSRAKISKIDTISDNTIKLLLKLKKENTEMLATEREQVKTRK